jgi:hypothetical protein
MIKMCASSKACLSSASLALRLARSRRYAQRKPTQGLIYQTWFLLSTSSSTCRGGRFARTRGRLTCSSQAEVVQRNPSFCRALLLICSLTLSLSPLGAKSLSSLTVASNILMPTLCFLHASTKCSNA